MYVYISETLLYFCFAILTASIILNFVPNNMKPDIRIPSTFLFNVVMGIALLSAVPVIKNTIFLTQFAQMGFWEILPDVLRDLEFGKAWIWMFILCALLMATMAYKDLARHFVANIIAAVLVLGLIFSYGWASHAAGLSESWGFLAESFHILAVSVWVGLMIAAGWFASQSNNWMAFLRWFSPLAIACVLTVIAAGLVLMQYIIPDYYNSWVVSYGQALLIKHLLLIPLLIFGLFNGFILKRKMQREHRFDPRGWLRAESIFVFLIFAVTAFMGMQRPPHEDPENPEAPTPSLLFRLLYPGEARADTVVQLGWTVSASILTAVAAVLLILLFTLRKKPLMSVVFGILFVVSNYLALMLSVR